MKPHVTWREGAPTAQVFISYARSTETQAQLIAKTLRSEGQDVWLDDALPPHRPYADVIEERLRDAGAVVVIWSSDAMKSQWVRAEADFARNAGTLVQLSVDRTIPPLPFNQLHCAQLCGWDGDRDASSWRTVFGSIRELLDGGGKLEHPTELAIPEKPSIAILPFANLNRDPDESYFVEGMMDEIVHALTRIRGLFVISSESSLALKGKDLDEEKAAARVGVRYILNGSVRRSASRVRISVRLIDTVRRAQIWAERFEDDLEDIFELQDRIAVMVAGEIEPSIEHAEVRRVSRQPIESLGCYDLYLRALPLRSSCRKEEVTRALQLLDRALALDCDFAPALAHAAGCHSQMYVSGWGENRDWHKKQGMLLAERAVRSGSDDASVLAQAANAIVDLDRDIERARGLAKRATTINPGCARAWFISGLVDFFSGNAEQAVQAFKTASRLDPISPLNDVIQVHIGAVLLMEGEYREGLRIIRATSHRTARIHLALAAVYGHLGMAEDSIREFAMFQKGSAVSASDVIAASTFPDRYKSAVREGIDRALRAMQPTEP